MKNIIENAVSHEYLGFCEMKGFIYTVQSSPGNHRIIAIKGNHIEVLISYVAPIEEEVNND